MSLLLIFQEGRKQWTSSLAPTTYMDSPDQGLVLLFWHRLGFYSHLRINPACERSLFVSLFLLCANVLKNNNKFKKKIKVWIEGNQKQQCNSSGKIHYFNFNGLWKISTRALQMFLYALDKTDLTGTYIVANSKSKNTHFPPGPARCFGLYAYHGFGIHRICISVNSLFYLQ